MQTHVIVSRSFSHDRSRALASASRVMTNAVRSTVDWNAISFITQQFGKGSEGRNYDTLTSVLLNLKKALRVEEKNAGPLAV